MFLRYWGGIRFRKVVPAALIAVGLLATMIPAASARVRSDRQVEHPVSVAALDVSSDRVAPGTTVDVDVTIVSTEVRRLAELVVAVRDSRGRGYDFPLLHGVTVGPEGRHIHSSRVFTRVGDYRYFVAYRVGDRWVDLKPVQTFSVVDGSGTVPGSTTSTSTTAAPPPSTTTPRPTTTQAPTTTVSPGSTVPGKPAGPSGYTKLVFNDEFNGLTVDWSKWSDASSAEADGGHGNKGNSQLEWNQRQNCSVSGGILTMTARPDSITSPSGNHYDWSSCLLSSAPSFQFQYGYIQIRSQMPAPKGFWPAFWTWQAAGNNRWTETDVYEFYSDNQSRLYLTQHSGAGGGCQTSAPAGVSSSFHTYGADIKPTGTDFYIDGRLVCSAGGTSTGMTNLIIDMFVYAQIPPAPGTVATHKVDWVRAWQ